MAIVLIALCLRLIALMLWSADLETDTDAYLSIARSIANGDGYLNASRGEPTAFRPPLYPLLWATIYFANLPTLSMGIVQVLLGTATVLITGKIAAQLNLRPTHTMLAMILVACDPILLRYTAHAMTETLFTFLITLLLLTWMKTSGDGGKRQWLVGVLLGLCGLCRPTIWGLAILASVYWFYRKMRGDTARGSWRLIVAAMLVMSPWAVRNWITFGRPIVTTTHGGYTLLLGNNPVFYREVVVADFGKSWPANSLDRWQQSLEGHMSEEQISGEIARDAWMNTRAHQNIKSAPSAFARSCVLRFVRFWSVAPTDASTIQRYAIGTFYSAILATCVFQLFHAVFHRPKWDWPSLLLLATVTSFSIIHTLYWSNMRMRAPLIPAIAVIAVGALASHRENIGITEQ